MKNETFAERKLRSFAFSKKVYLTTFKMTNDNPALDDIFQEIYDYYAEKLENGCLFAKYIIYSKDIDEVVNSKRFNEARAFVRHFNEYFQNKESISKDDIFSVSSSHIRMIRPFGSHKEHYKLGFILPAGSTKDDVIAHFKSEIDKQVIIKRELDEAFIAKNNKTPTPVLTTPAHAPEESTPSFEKFISNTAGAASFEPTTFHKSLTEPSAPVIDVPVWEEPELEPEAIDEPMVAIETQETYQEDQDNDQDDRQEQTHSVQDENAEDDEEKQEKYDTDELMRELEALDENI